MPSRKLKPTNHDCDAETIKSLPFGLLNDIECQTQYDLESYRSHYKEFSEDHYEPGIINLHTRHNRHHPNVLYAKDTVTLIGPSRPATRPCLFFRGISASLFEPLAQIQALDTCAESLACCCQRSIYTNFFPRTRSISHYILDKIKIYISSYTLNLFSPSRVGCDGEPCTKKCSASICAHMAICNIQVISASTENSTLLRMRQSSFDTSALR